MTVFHRKPSLRAQFLEEKTQNLQLVNCPKSTLESPHWRSAPTGPADSQIKCLSIDQYFAFKHIQVGWLKNYCEHKHTWLHFWGRLTLQRVTSFIELQIDSTQILPFSSCSTNSFFFFFCLLFVYVLWF